MNVGELKNQIMIKQFQKFYIFSGDEWKVQRIYLDQLSKASGKELKFIDSVTDIYKKLGNTSFIAKSYLYVVRDDKELMSNEKLQNQIEQILNQNMLVLIISSVDKRLKFYKAYKDTICEFDRLNPAILRKYIKCEIELSDVNADKLAEICENDYGRCLLEIDKIKQFDHEATNSAFEHLLKAGIIYQPPKDAIFDFIDAVLDRKVNLAFNLYHQCLAVGEATMVMISVLYTNARAVLQVQNCSGDIAKTTGLNGWEINNAKKHLNKYRNGELMNILKLCQQCQQGIVTGVMDEENVVEYILVNVF